MERDPFKSINTTPLPLLITPMQVKTRRKETTFCKPRTKEKSEQRAVPPGEILTKRNVACLFVVCPIVYGRKGVVKAHSIQPKVFAQSINLSGV